MFREKGCYEKAMEEEKNHQVKQIFFDHKRHRDQLIGLQFILNSFAAYEVVMEKEAKVESTAIRQMREEVEKITSKN